MKAAAIIAAAGLGKRMGGDAPKQFLKIGGQPIIMRTLARFDETRHINLIIITAEPSRTGEVEKLVAKGRLSKEWLVVAGGEKRQDSVRNGLNVVPSGTQIVSVHDGVRPFINPQLIDKSIEVADSKGACIIAIPVRDTIKLCDDGCWVSETLNRQKLMAAQTPQTFRYEILREAFDAAYRSHFYGTDEASLVERMGKRVKLLMGHPENIKITTPDDIKIAEAIIRTLSKAEKRERQCV